jgi:hemerythrin superfamily protein
MGPSLADGEVHGDIHSAARSEMEAGMELLCTAVHQLEEATSLWIARALAEGWRQRVLTHAQAEEEDLFPLVAARYPDHAATLAALTRDHELMRLLLEEAERELDVQGKVTPGALDRFSALLHLQRQHSSYEEQSLLEHISAAALRAPHAPEEAGGR